MKKTKLQTGIGRMSPSSTTFDSAAAIRRKIITWTPPVVAAITLPVHAALTSCLAVPVMLTVVPSKCSGAPPFGEAVVAIQSNAADALEIQAVSFSGNGDDDILSVPTLPVVVTDTQGLEIVWNGDGTDALTCLPLSIITIDVTYVCVDSIVDAETVSFSLTEILAEAL